MITRLHSLHLRVRVRVHAAGSAPAGLSKLTDRTVLASQLCKVVGVNSLYTLYNNTA